MFDWLDIPGDRIGSPDTIDRAFVLALQTDEYDYLMEYEREKWGPRRGDTFLRALKNGNSEERLIALWAIGCLQPPQACDVLKSCINSSSVLERWSSILCLGEMREQSILSQLLELLHEFLPVEGVSQLVPMDQGWIDWHRLLIPRILRSWTDPLVSYALRKVLEIFMYSVQVIPAMGWGIVDVFPEIVAYELGYRGAFETLTESILVPLHLRVALVDCVLGYYIRMHPDTCADDIRFVEGFANNQKHRASLIEIFQAKLSLSDEKATECL